MISIPDHIPVETIQLFTSEQAVHYRIIPIEKENGSITVATDFSGNAEQLIKELELVKSSPVTLQQVDKAVLNELLIKHYRASNNGSGSTSKKSADLQNLDTFLDDLVIEAKTSGSSDIHIEAFEKQCRVRFRIDGKLIERYSIAHEEYQGLINKLKNKVEPRHC